MSKFTKEMIDDYASKLLIGLTPEENNLVLKEFDIIDAEMNLINQIPEIAQVEPMTHPLDDFEFTLREDTIEESIAIIDALLNCDCYEGREIEVPKVVGGNNFAKNN